MPVEEGEFYSCMERMKAGDKSALHEIYHAYIGYIYTIILQIVQNRADAEDLTSEFFIKLLAAFPYISKRKGTSCMACCDCAQYGV